MIAKARTPRIGSLGCIRPSPRNRPFPNSSGPATGSVNVTSACQSMSLVKRVPEANDSARSPRRWKGSRCTRTSATGAPVPAWRNAWRTAAAARASSAARSAAPFAWSDRRSGSIRRRRARGKASGVRLRQRRPRRWKRLTMRSSSAPLQFSEDHAIGIHPRQLERRPKRDHPQPMGRIAAHKRQDGVLPSRRTRCPPMESERCGSGMACPNLVHRDRSGNARLYPTNRAIRHTDDLQPCHALP